MSDKTLRQQLKIMLTEPNAHGTFHDIVDDFPASHYGTSIENQSHTAWQLLEHLRLCQWDIMEFSRNPDHVSPSFPGGYWPKDTAPSTEDAWKHSVDQFDKDLDQMLALIADESIDLYSAFPHGDGQTLLREALLLAKHNSYHLGQVAALKNVLKNRS